MGLRTREETRSHSPRPQRIVFDNFEVDLRSGEIRKNGTRIRLQAQPFQVLALLLENAGEAVTREEICREIWPANVFVDFEHSLAAAVNKIREALGDAADNPRYIETLPKRGYRFIGKIRPEPPVEMPVAGQAQLMEVVPSAPVIPGPSWRWVLGVVAATALVATAIFFLVRYRKPAETSPSAKVLTAVPFTSYPGAETAPSLSPDGSRIAFAWDKGEGISPGRPSFDLYVKAQGSETVLRLTNHPAEWISSAWSPDGTQIAFHRMAEDDNGIYVVPALGGPERKLIVTHTPYNLAAPLSWSPDGKWIAYADTEDGAPGDRTFLLNVMTLESHEFPHDPACLHEGLLTFSHSGKELAMLCVHNTTTFEYLITDLQGKQKRSLATFREFPTGLAWSGADKSLIVTEATAEANEPDEIRVSDGEVNRLALHGVEWPTISGDGTKLAFSRADSHSSIWRRDLQHPEAPAKQMYNSTRQQDNSQYSPDGKYVAFDSTRSGKWSVWLADTEGNNLVPISREAVAGFPRWSPDSRKVAFEMIEPDGHAGVYIADISDRVAHKLKSNIQESHHPSWSHDGRWIYFLGFEGTGHQLYRCPAEGGEATLLHSLLDKTLAMESLDGKQLYFPSKFGDAKMMMLALEGPGGKPEEVPGMPKISDETQWTLVPEGIYFSPQDSPRSICFYDFATRQTRQIFIVEKDLAAGMSVSPDRRYMLYSQIDGGNADIMLVEHFR